MTGVRVHENGHEMVHTHLRGVSGWWPVEPRRTTRPTCDEADPLMTANPLPFSCDVSSCICGALASLVLSALICVVPVAVMDVVTLMRCCAGGAGGGPGGGGEGGGGDGGGGEGGLGGLGGEGGEGGGGDAVGPNRPSSDLDLDRTGEGGSWLSGVVGSEELREVVKAGASWGGGEEAGSMGGGGLGVVALTLATCVTLKFAVGRDAHWATTEMNCCCRVVVKAAGLVASCSVSCGMEKGGRGHRGRGGGGA